MRLVLHLLAGGVWGCAAWFPSGCRVMLNGKATSYRSLPTSSPCVPQLSGC